MSDNEENAYKNMSYLHTNEGATAAAVEMLTKACSSAGEGQKINLISQIIQQDFIMVLRDKIKAAASE